MGLFGVLSKCVSALEGLKGPVHPKSWDPQARAMATYLFHHVLVLCTQLRQIEVLNPQFSGDLPARYTMDPKVNPFAAKNSQARILDLTFELALLGETTWDLAQEKLKVVLTGELGSEGISDLLLKMSERQHTQVAKQASQLA